MSLLPSLLPFASRQLFAAMHVSWKEKPLSFWLALLIIQLHTTTTTEKNLWTKFYKNPWVFASFFSTSPSPSLVSTHAGRCACLFTIVHRVNSCIRATTHLLQDIHQTSHQLQPFVLTWKYTKKQCGLHNTAAGELDFLLFWQVAAFCACILSVRNWSSMLFIFRLLFRVLGVSS